MYKIIGGDGQEYGPVSDADLRKWIAEGRLSAQSMAKAEGDAEFRPLSAFPEFAGAFGPVASYGAPSRDAVDWASRDYELDIGGCISRGWNLFANNLGILLGSALLYFLMIIIAFAIVGGILGIAFAALPPGTTQSVAFQFSRDLVTRIVAALAVGPLTGGLYCIFIGTMRGEPTGVGELFIGFQRMFLQLFLGYLIFSLALALCVAPFTIVLLSRMAPLLAQAQHGQMQPSQMHDFFAQMWSAYAGSVPIFLICMVPAIYFMTNLQFVIPLIIDQEMDVWTAIKTSWRMVHKHWFSVFGLVFLVGLITLGGFLLCCIGVFFAFAIGTAAIVYAYETIFGERPVSA